jgi:hypothetical protein
MTQDQDGKAHGTGYVARGEVVPDDDADEFRARQAAPVTHFQKVASAARGDAPDPSASGSAASGQAGTTSRDGPDPNGSWPSRPHQAGTANATNAPGASDDHDHGDDEGDTGPDEAAAAEGGFTPDDQDLAGTTQPAVAADVTGRHAGARAEPELRPGEADAALGDVSDLTYGSLLPDASEFRERWQQVQFRFVDDPQGSVTEAADVIAQVTVELEAAIAERQRAITERQRSLRGRWDEGARADTETLRATLLMYRAFLDRLTGPRAS